MFISEQKPGKSDDFRDFPFYSSTFSIGILPIVLTETEGYPVELYLCIRLDLMLEAYFMGIIIHGRWVDLGWKDPGWNSHGCLFGGEHGQYFPAASGCTAWPPSMLSGLGCQAFEPLKEAKGEQLLGSLTAAVAWGHFPTTERQSPDPPLLSQTLSSWDPTRPQVEKLLSVSGFPCFLCCIGLAFLLFFLVLWAS